MFENFPYTNFHDLNLDWIVKEMQQFLSEKETIYTDMQSERDAAISAIEDAGATELTEVQSTADQIGRDVIASIPSDYSTLAHNALKVSTLISGAYTSETGIETIDSPVANNLYRLQLTSIPAWFPSDYPLDARTMYLLDVDYIFSGTDTIYRYIYDENFDLRYKMMKQPFGQWSEWTTYNPLTVSAIRVGALITGSVTGTALENKSTLEANVLYRAQLTEQPSWIPSDIPMNGQIRHIIKLEYPWVGSPADIIIILDETLNKVGFNMRQPGQDWGAWFFYGANGLTIKVTNDQTNITLSSAMASAYFWGNTRVEIAPGDYTISDFSGMGFYIGKNVSIIGSGNTRIIANSAEGLQYYSIFHAQSGDFTIENIELRGVNIRYCLHDDPPVSVQDQAAYHIIRNCRFYIDNTSNSVWPNNQCIGGGLGKATTILIENCVFESPAPDGNGLLSYHNTGLADARSYITIKDCYFLGVGGTARISWYGESTLQTIAIVTGCNLGADVIFSAETVDSVIQNITLYKWANVIRTMPDILIVDRSLTVLANNDYVQTTIPSGYTPVNVYNGDWNTLAFIVRGFTIHSGSLIIFASTTTTTDRTFTAKIVFARN